MAHHWTQCLSIDDIGQTFVLGDIVITCDVLQQARTMFLSLFGVSLVADSMVV